MAYLVIKSAVVSHRKSSFATIFYIVQKVQYRRKSAMKQEKKSNVLLRSLYYVKTIRSLLLTTLKLIPQMSYLQILQWFNSLLRK